MATTQTGRMSEETYRRLALADSGRQLELYRGQLREKPGMSVEHGSVMFRLAVMLDNQLDSSEFRVRPQHARLRRSSNTYFVPDVAVIPAALEDALRERPGSLDAYPEPLPLVAEVWSPSTGDYDIYEKLPGYQARGDREILYVHPFEQTVTVWRRQPNGEYVQTIYRDGTIRLESLPGVVIELPTLFRL